MSQHNTRGPSTPVNLFSRVLWLLVRAEYVVAFTSLKNTSNQLAPIAADKLQNHLQQKEPLRKLFGLI